MARIPIDIIGVREFNDSPEVHDRDAVGDVLHDREIMRDEQVAEPHLPLQIEKQVQDLALDGDIERGDRLVADDQTRLECDRPGDADPLPLAA